MVAAMVYIQPMTALLEQNPEIKLLEAQAKAELLFAETERRGLIRAGVSERDLSDDIYKLALELFGIRKYWHKRIVRSGANTLCPYRENPPNLAVQEDDLVFFDFGPVFEEWEADFGRTYVLGTDERKHKMVADLAKVFDQTKQFFKANADVTGNQLYADVCERARQHGWVYGGPHAGHLIGIFPHEQLLGECPENYICQENTKRMQDPDINGAPRHWILEVHLVDLEQKFGAFYEELLTIDNPA
jgi:Xaa-Pro dipeptidase